MDSIIKLSQQLKEQSKLINSALGPLNGLSEAFKAQNKLHFTYNASGLSNISSLIKSFSEQTRTFSANETNLKIDFESNFKSIFPENYQNTLKIVTQSLSELSAHNRMFSEKFSNYATSQIILSNNLNLVASAFKDSHLQQFNSFQVAVNGISKTYLKSIEVNKNWNDIEIAENINELISKETEKITEAANATLDDLEKLKKSIIEELGSILVKTKSEKARLFILDLIATISFLLALYSTYQQENAKTTQDVIDELKEEIRKSNFDIANHIDFELAKLNKTRIAKTSVKLRYSTKKNSKVIGIVKSGQEVSVIEIQHKYLLISYLDKENGEPKSGFVIKKYFELK